MVPICGWQFPANVALFKTDRKTDVYHNLCIISRRELYLFARRIAQIKNKVNWPRETLQPSLMATKLLLSSRIEKKKLKFIQ